MTEFEIGDSIVQAVVREVATAQQHLQKEEIGKLIACSDWRKGGLPDGY